MPPGGATGPVPPEWCSAAPALSTVIKSSAPALAVPATCATGVALAPTPAPAGTKRKSPDTVGTWCAPTTAMTTMGLTTSTTTQTCARLTPLPRTHLPPPPMHADKLSASRRGPAWPRETFYAVQPPSCSQVQLLDLGGFP
jgi:hypothetical protein